MRSNYCLGTGNQNQLSSVNIVAVFVFGSIVQYNQISLLCKIVRIKNHPTMLETYFLKPYGNEHEKAERISLKEESGNMDVGCIKRKFILKLYCCSAAHSDEVSNLSYSTWKQLGELSQPTFWAKCTCCSGTKKVWLLKLFSYISLMNQSKNKIPLAVGDI